jgi:hypothetical protein
MKAKVEELAVLHEQVVERRVFTGISEESESRRS